MDDNNEELFAVVAWSTADLQALKPDWTTEQCAQWFNQNEKYLQEQLVELGWGLLKGLLGLDPTPGKPFLVKGD